MSFADRKTAALESLSSHIDKSPKGFLDAPIEDLVASINASSSFYTTSSCSGRITLFLDNGSKGGEWILISHETVTKEQMREAVNSFRNKLKRKEGLGDNLCVRYEPFILSVECQDFEAATKLLKVAVASGFRESGLAGVDKRFMLSVRCSIRLETPIWEAGADDILISDEFLDYLTTVCNRKMISNHERTNNFHRQFVNAFIERKSDAVLIHKPQIAANNDEKNIALKLDFLEHRFENMLGTVSTTNSALHPINELEVFCACAPVKDGNALQDYLRNLKFKSKLHRVIHIPRENPVFVAVPILEEAFHSLLLRDDFVYTLAVFPESKFKKSVLQALPSSDSKSFNVAPSVVVSTSLIENSSQSPFKLMVKALKIAVAPHLASIIHNNKLHINESELWSLMSLDIPKKWEILGNIALLPRNCFSNYWRSFLTESVISNLIWGIVATNLGVAKIGKQQEISPDLKRHSQVKILFPLEASGVTVLKELGCIMTLDVTKCMFSSGNGSEKARLFKLVNPNEIVLDMYAGIGYFSIPILVHTNAYVHMCEWNDNALVSLRENLNLNSIDLSRYKVHPGDNRLCTLADVADRVLLGLIPTSSDGWKVSLQALKKSGGMLHIHANVKDGNESEYESKMLSDLAILSKDLGRDYQFSIVFVSKVKNYAPRVKHLVYDIKVFLKDSGNHYDLERVSNPNPRLFWSIFDYIYSILKLDTYFRLQKPVILSIDTGKTWNPAYLMKSVPLNKTVNVMIGVENFSFTSCNYLQKSMTLVELISRASNVAPLNGVLNPPYFLSEHEKYYMRSMGDNVHEKADFPTSFPLLAKDLALPREYLIEDENETRPFSSCLRVASAGTRLWTHFDIADNFLVHVTGRKKVVLFPPSDLPFLYVTTSSSEVIDIENPDLVKYPKFAYAHPIECILEPGDVLYIPALWFHNVVSLDFCVSVNFFWHHLKEEYYDNTDIYGNKDLKLGQEAQISASWAKKYLDELPEPYRSFYKLKVTEIIDK